MLNELVTPEVLQPTPLKRISPRFEAITRRGRNAITFRSSEITRKIIRLRILNHMGIKGYMVKSNLIQPRVNPEIEIDEGNGEAAGR